MENNKLPNGWVWKKLGEVCKVESGNPAPQGEKYFELGSHPFVRVKHISNTEEGYIKETNLINNEAIQKGRLRLFLKNSIVFAKSGMSINLNVKARLKADSYVVSHLAILTPEENIINPDYLFYWSKSFNFSNLSRGTTLPSIKTSDIKNVEIPVPPLSIQKQIVLILDRAEKLKHRKEKANEETGKVLPSIFASMFGKLELQGFDNSIFEIIDGDRGSNYPHGKDFSKEGYCLFLNTGNVRAYGFNFDNTMFITKEKSEQLRKGKAQINDVILTTRGTVGNVALYDDDVHYKNIRINSGMVLLRPNINKIIPRFLECLIQMPVIKNQFSNVTSGSAQPQLPITNLKKIRIPLPSIKLQQEFAKIVERVEKTRAYQEQSTQEVNNLFDALMQKAFKGELK